MQNMPFAHRPRVLSGLEHCAAFIIEVPLPLSAPKSGSRLKSTGNACCILLSDLLKESVWQILRRTVC